MKNLIQSLSILSSLFLIACNEKPITKKLNTVDFRILQAVSKGEKNEYEGIECDTINVQAKNLFLVMFTTFKSIEGSRSLVKPVFSRDQEIERDSLVKIDFGIVGREAYTAISGATEKPKIDLSFDDHPNILNNYSAFDELVKDYNYSFSGQIDVNTSDYGERGIAFKLNLNGLEIPLNVRNAVVLEFIFKSGRHVKKERVFYFKRK
jgi:hypothetical protein